MSRRDCAMIAAMAVVTVVFLPVLIPMAIVLTAVGKRRMRKGARASTVAIGWESSR